MTAPIIRFLTCCAALAAVGGCSLEKVEEYRCTVENPECPGDLVCDGERCVARSAPTPDRGAPDRGVPDRGVPDQRAPDQRAPDLTPPDAAPPLDLAADFVASDGSSPDAAAPDLLPPDGPVPDAPAPDGSCTPGTTAACYTGAAGTLGVGTCVEGQATCEASGAWGPCFGQVTPMSDTCDGKDNDCDGTADPGCQCTNGQTQSCGSDVGECVAGTQTCNLSGAWGSCVGAVNSAPEVCDGKDNDCNGAPDDPFTCVRGTTGLGKCDFLGTQCKNSNGTPVCNSTCSGWTCTLSGACKAGGAIGGACAAICKIGYEGCRVCGDDCLWHCVCLQLGSC